MANEQVGPAYPKWRYRGGESQLVQNAVEEKELGHGWKDNPGPGPSAAEKAKADADAKAKADAEAKAKADKAAADAAAAKKAAEHQG